MWQGTGASASSSRAEASRCRVRAVIRRWRPLQAQRLRLPCACKRTPTTRAREARIPVGDFRKCQLCVVHVAAQRLPYGNTLHANLRHFVLFVAVHDKLVQVPVEDRVEARLLRWLLAV